MNSNSSHRGPSERGTAGIHPSGSRILLQAVHNFPSWCGTCGGNDEQDRDRQVVMGDVVIQRLPSDGIQSL